MRAPAKTSAGRSTGRSVGAIMAATSSRWRDEAASAMPMKNIMAKRESLRRTASPMAKSDGAEQDTPAFVQAAFAAEQHGCEQPEQNAEADA